jgi:hypothetical protein
MPSSDKLASEDGDGDRRQKAANRLYMESEQMAVHREKYRTVFIAPLTIRG